MGATIKSKPKRAKKGYRPKVAPNYLAAFETLNRLSVTKSVIQEFSVPLNEKDRADMELSYVISVDRLAHGKATAEDLGNLGFMCNVSMVLCERDFGAEYLDEVRVAQRAVIAAMAHGMKGRTMGVTGDQLALVRRAYQLHMAQCEIAGRGHLLAAGKEVTRRQTVGDVMKVAA